MVFGWGKKKTEKKLEEIPQNRQIVIDSIPKIIDEHLDVRSTQTVAEIKSLYDLTTPLIKQLADIGKKLEQDTLAVDDIDKHLRIIVVRGKKQVIDVIKKETRDLPSVSNLDEAQELSNVLSQTLKKIGDVLGRQTRVIHIFAKKYAEKLKYILAQMNSNNSEIQQLLKNYDNKKIISEELLELLGKIQNSYDDIQHNKQRISELTTDCKDIEQKIISLQQSIEEKKSTTEYQEYLKLQSSLESFNSEKQQIKNQINSQFTKISRPLSRYEYVSSDKEQKNLLAELISEPIEVINEENKDMIIIILENIRKGIGSGSISVKDIDKSMKQITETEEMLDSFINQIDVFHDKIKKIKNQISVFNTNQLFEFERELEKTLSHKYENEQKIKTFEKEIEQTNSHLPIFLSNLESKLQEFSNIQYTISKPS